jgi:NAD(P)H-dependent FMN reductase
LAELGASHHALLIASPEYNGFITPLLKNTLDWMCRAEPDPFPGKVAAVISASPGPLGGMKSQILARQLLGNLGCLVVPASCTLPRAHEAISPDGQLKDARAANSVAALVAQLIETTRKLTDAG